MTRINYNPILINRVEPVFRASTNQDNSKRKNSDFAEILKSRLKKKGRKQYAED